MNDLLTSSRIYLFAATSRLTNGFSVRSIDHGLRRLRAVRILLLDNAEPLRALGAFGVASMALRQSRPDPTSPPLLSKVNPTAENSKL